MSRRIHELSMQAAGGAAVAPGVSKPDDYFDKAVKYVPADVIAAWTAIVALVNKTAGIPSNPVLLVCFAVVLAITFWWTLRQTDTPGQPKAVKQAVVAVIAFAVWVLALGDLNGPISAAYAGWDAAYGKIVLILFTLVSGRI
ncbi:MAG: hypothetical protein JO001_29195 [Alphaproteobacteria bacterium]|nr:hypothetical protein [Alphaproteobacteria bacterium]